MTTYARLASKNSVREPVGSNSAAPNSLSMVISIGP